MEKDNSSNSKDYIELKKEEKRGFWGKVFSFFSAKDVSLIAKTIIVIMAIDIYVNKIRLGESYDKEGFITLALTIFAVFSDVAINLIFEKLKKK